MHTSFLPAVFPFLEELFVAWARLLFVGVFVGWRVVTFGVL